jgi:hypothetical protein
MVWQPGSNSRIAVSRDTESTRHSVLAPAFMLKPAAKTIDNMIKTIFFTVVSSVLPSQTVFIRANT